MATSDHVPEAFDSTPTKPSSTDPQKELILVEPTDASRTVEDDNPSISIPNVAKYLDEDEINSLATSSKEALSEETINRLRDILPILSHKGEKAQRNLSNHEALLAKRNSNRQEAKELTQLIDDLKKSSLRIDPELSQLEIKRAELEKELENVKATIDHHKSNLAKITDAIKQKKQELLAKVREGRAIRSSLEDILGSAKEDKQQIVEFDAIRLEVLKAIQDVLDLFILNDSLCPLPRVGEPSDAASSVSASSSNSSDSYNGDDAWRFLREWRATQDRYSEATWENDQLEICLAVSQAALHAVEEEASATWARLAESNAMVATLMVQLESLQLAANVAMDVINDQGPLINTRLHDVPARIQEIVLHGVHHGALVALAAM
ncbi:uncharacterized protein [Miscanthus floridulus]|uniref:uncharacterized protein n=1 Tax=Miscanthus floridulus TaxID=154761 RepID=UPI003459931B